MSAPEWWERVLRFPVLGTLLIAVASAIAGGVSVVDAWHAQWDRQVIAGAIFCLCVSAAAMVMFFAELRK